MTARRNPIHALALGFAAACAATTAMPAAANTSAEYFRAKSVSNNLPQLLSDAEQQYYRSVFQAIDRESWGEVESLLAQRGDGPLHDVARAEYYLPRTVRASNCPRCSHGWQRAPTCPTLNASAPSA